MRHILEGSAQLLDGNVLLGGCVVGCAHDPLGPRPDGLQILIALEDCEPCVAHFYRVEMRAGLPRHLVVIWRSEKKFSIRGLGSAPIFATEPDKGDEKSRLGYLNVFIC